MNRMAIKNEMGRIWKTMQWRTGYALVFLLASIILANCGGGGNGGGGVEVVNGSGLVGKITVDDHVFNPEFFTEGTDDAYVLLSYFDESGNQLSYHELWEWEGDEPTFLDDYRYTYDENGNLTKEGHELTYTREAPVFYSHAFNEKRYTYHTNGNLIKVEEALIGADDDGDGDFDDQVLGLKKITVYSYDSILERLKTVAVDDAADGLINSSGDTTTSYTYIGPGNNIAKETVVDGNGITRTTVYQYDSNDRKIKETFYATAVRFSTGLISSVTLFSYDAKGLLIKVEIDNHTPLEPPAKDTVDGIADIVLEYIYGNSGELIEKSREQIFITFSEKDTTQYLYEVIDSDGNGTPEVILTYVSFLGIVINDGGGYPDYILPEWVTNAQDSVNNNNDDDGWGVNWDGHGSNCSTCGNMIGQVNRIIFGF